MKGDKKGGAQTGGDACAPLGEEKGECDL